MFDSHPRFNHRVAAVPKGFLRHYILKILAEKPMSGSEIVQEINSRTEGLWKPSPGSIYPLLSRLNKKSYIQKIKKNDSGLKRYKLTEKGRALHHEMVKDKVDARKKTALLIPSFIGSFEPGEHPQEVLELNKSVRNLLTSYYSILDALRERYSNKTVKKASSAVDKAVQIIEELVKELK